MSVFDEGLLGAALGAILIFFCGSKLNIFTTAEEEAGAYHANPSSLRKATLLLAGLGMVGGFFLAFASLAFLLAHPGELPPPPP